jgi:hypothetical protein
MKLLLCIVYAIICGILCSTQFNVQLTEHAPHKTHIKILNKYHSNNIVYRESDHSDLTKTREFLIEAEHDEVIKNSVHLHIKHNSIVRLHNLKISGNITITQEGEGTLHINGGTWRKHHTSGSVHLSSKHIHLSGNTIDHSFRFNNTEGRINIDNNRITGFNSKFHFEKGDGQVHVTNNHIYDHYNQESEMFIFNNMSKVVFDNNTMANIVGPGHGNGSLVEIYHPIELVIRGNDIRRIGNMNTIFKIHDLSQNILIENNNLVLSTLTTCNQTSQTLGLYIIIQYDTYELDSLIVRNNMVTFNQLTGVAYFMPFFQYFPFYFQDSAFVTNVQALFDNDPNYYNVSYSREPELIVNYTLTNLASTSNFLNIYNNTIYINRNNPFDNTAILCQNTLFTATASLLVSNKITEKTDITQSFIWLHLIPTFGFSSVLINNNKIIVTATAVGPIAYNPHSMNYQIANSFIFMHGYSNVASMTINDNSIQVNGNIVLSGTSSDTAIRANIKRGVFLTDNTGMTESSLVSMFNLNSYIASKNKGSLSNLILPYQYVIARLLSFNTQLFNFPYGIQLEPISNDLYNGTDQCNYICTDVDICNACYWVDSINNPLQTKFSLHSTGVCFNKVWSSDAFKAGSGCRHSDLKIRGPIVNLETVIFATKNLYDYTLNIMPENPSQSVVFRINDNMILTQGYADAMSGGTLTNAFTPYVISVENVVEGSAIMDTITFTNISFVLDTSVVINNKLLFDFIVPSTQNNQYTLNKLTFEGCSFTGVQSPFISQGYYSGTLMNVNNSNIVGLTQRSVVSSVNSFAFINNHVNGVKDILSNDYTSDNNDGIFKNITMKNNLFENINNGILNLEIGDNIIFDDNVCINCLPNQLTGVVVMISGFTSGVCYDYCSVQNNNINISTFGLDTTQGTAVFNLDNINNALIVTNNKDNAILYYGILYTDLSSFTCDFDGMRLLKGLNFDIYGTVYDVSCGGSPNVSCTGVGCLVDLSLIPADCTVNKSISVGDPRYYFSQFPSWQIAIDYCRAQNNRVIYGLPDVYEEENLNIKYTIYNGETEATLRLIGLSDSNGKKPVIIGRNHAVNSITPKLNLYIENILFMNGNGVFSPFVGLDSVILGMSLTSTLDNVYIKDTTFFGVVFYNNVILSVPSNLTQFYNVIDQNYYALKGVINPALSNVNTRLLANIRASHVATFLSNTFIGSNDAALYFQFYTTDSVSWAVDKVITVLDNNAGENNWGSFLQIINQFNANITNNICVYFCGCYSQQTTFLELIQVSFWITTLPTFTNTGGFPLYSLFLIGNEVTASINDLPVNNPLFTTDRIVTGFPFASTNIITMAVSIISSQALTSTNFQEFEIKNNTFEGFPAGLSLRLLDPSIEIAFNEPLGNTPLYNDLIRYMREIQRHNGNQKIRGFFVDIEGLYPVTSSVISPNYYCNGLCPPSFLSIYFCRINMDFTLLSNPTTFGVTDFTTIKDAVHSCPYNRAVMDNPVHYENIDISSLNYDQNQNRNIPFVTEFLLESGSNGVCTIHGFQHRINQINDFTSTKYIPSLRFNNLIFKMFVTTANTLPLQSTPCFTNDDSNYRFSSIFYMYVSNPSAKLELVNFQITYSSFIFEVGDANDHQTSILNRILVCPNQVTNPNLIAFNCEECAVRSFLFETLTFSSVDGVGQPYHTQNYSLNGISVRLPVSSFSTNPNSVIKVVTNNINVVSSISYATRRFLEFINIQYYTMNTITVPVCNPNPSYNLGNVTVSDNNACIFVSTIHMPSMSVFFNQSMLAQPVVTGLILGSVYTTTYNQQDINPYKASPKGTSKVPYNYVGFQWNVDVNIPISNYNSFYLNAMIYNITGNTVTGTATSNIDIGIEIKGNNFTNAFSCTDFLNQVAPINNATLFGYLDKYLPKKVASIVNNNNPNAVGKNFNSIIVDREGTIKTALYNPNSPGSSIFNCFACTTGCSIVDTVTIFNRLYFLLAIFATLLVFVWLTFGFGCRFLMGTEKWVESYSNVRNMEYQSVSQIRDLNNKLEIVNGK